MPAPSFQLETRFHALQALLEAHSHLWRPAPFHLQCPDWCALHPELTGALLGLTDQEIGRMVADDQKLRAWLQPFLPQLAGLEPLLQTPCEELSAPAPEHLDWAVPGRKLAQIQAFAGALQPVGSELLEWCAGKGHLGRLLAACWQLPVQSLEWEADLCGEGQALAQRAGVAQSFLPIDVTTDQAAAFLRGRHGVALHACGDLHRHMVRAAVEQGAAAMDLAPCCYNRTASPQYRPLNPDARLRLTRDELRLAVAGHATASARELRQRERDMAWKLGFLALRAELTGDTGSRSFRPVPAAWSSEGFQSWCRRLAEREALPLPQQVAWSEWERIGWARRAEVARLDLLRSAFRRPLELWLVLDLALYLQRSGYEVTIREFCRPELTPRNLLISARRPVRDRGEANRGEARG